MSWVEWRRTQLNALKMAVSNTSSQNQIESLHIHTNTNTHGRARSQEEKQKAAWLARSTMHTHAYTRNNSANWDDFPFRIARMRGVHVCVRTNVRPSSRLTLARVHFEYKSSSMLFFPMDDFDRYMKPASNSPSSIFFVHITHIYCVYFVIYFRCCHFFRVPLPHSLHPIHRVCSIVCNNECMFSFKWKPNTTILIENFRQNFLRRSCFDYCGIFRGISMQLSSKYFWLNE